jgi:hypothetical protein
MVGRTDARAEGPNISITSSTTGVQLSNRSPGGNSVRQDHTERLPMTAGTRFCCRLERWGSAYSIIPTHGGANMPGSAICERISLLTDVLLRLCDRGQALLPQPSGRRILSGVARRSAISKWPLPNWSSCFILACQAQMDTSCIWMTTLISCEKIKCVAGGSEQSTFQEDHGTPNGYGRFDLHDALLFCAIASGTISVTSYPPRTCESSPTE